MSNLKTTHLLIAWILWLSGGAYVFHKFCGTTTEVVSEASSVSQNEASNGVVASTNKVALFKESAIDIIQPLSPDLSKRIDSYLSSMKDDQDQNLIITALYGSHESNSGIFPDLGLARANNMKQLFVQMNVDPERIGIKSKKVKSDKASEFTGLEFNYADELETENTLEDYAVLFEHNPIVLYFKSDSESLDLNKDQRIALYDLSNYLDLDKEIKVNIDGHTDSTGKKSANVAMSKKRALAVRNLLINNGLDASRMKVQAYGPDRPIASNKTDAGKAKNRRVELVVQ